MKSCLKSILMFFALLQSNLFGQVNFDNAAIQEDGKNQAKIIISGTTSSTRVKVLDEINVFRDHTTFQLLFFAQMDQHVGLPVLTPFEKEIQVEELAYGTFTIRCFALNSTLLDSTFFFSPDSSAFLFPTDSLEQPDSLFILADTTFIVDYSAQTVVAASPVDKAVAHLVTFPNPFNAQTTFQFYIPATQFVTLNIYDTLGKNVTSMVSRELNQGMYSFTWDADAYSSGIYFYKLCCGEMSRIGRISLLK